MICRRRSSEIRHPWSQRHKLQSANLATICALDQSDMNISYKIWQFGWLCGLSYAGSLNLHTISISLISKRGNSVPTYTFLCAPGITRPPSDWLPDWREGRPDVLVIHLTQLPPPECNLELFSGWSDRISAGFRRKGWNFLMFYILYVYKYIYIFRALCG